MRQHLPTADDVRAAANRISPIIRRTPLQSSRTLDEICGGRVLLKCENLQRGGAFKLRGASNAILGLKEIPNGVATHSSGNHGAAVALAAGHRGVPATIIVPKGSSEAKKAAIRHYGGEIVECEPGMGSRQRSLDEFVSQSGATVIHPFDDPMVIAGQGTVALELLEDIPEIDTIITPVGGGGLLSGTLLAAGDSGRRIRTYGVEPAAADDARQSLRQKKHIMIDSPDTIADGLRASLGKLNYQIITKHVDNIVCVSEAEIISAMRFVWERMKLVIEPSAAVTVAALLGKYVDVQGAVVGCVISGGNVDLDDLPW